MGAETDQLRNEIAATRADLSRDVDALTYKASPSRAVGERVDRTRSRLSSVRDSMRDRVFGTGQRAGEGIQGTMSSAQSGVSSAASSVQGAASSVQDTVSTVATEAPQQVRRQTEGNPLAAGLVAFGVGWLVGSLAPPSRAEADASQRITDLAREQAQPVMAEVKETASDVGQSMREPVSQAAESVKSTAQQGATEVKDQGVSSAQQVREQANDQSSFGRGAT
jgi:ElaB/YqjD/DUF883 family membrane-anchored ribosome-binding protein